MYVIWIAAAAEILVSFIGGLAVLRVRKFSKKKKYCSFANIGAGGSFPSCSNISNSKSNSCQTVLFVYFPTNIWHDGSFPLAWKLKAIEFRFPPERISKFWQIFKSSWQFSTCLGKTIEFKFSLENISFGQIIDLTEICSRGLPGIKKSNWSFKLLLLNRTFGG